MADTTAEDKRHAVESARRLMVEEGYSVNRAAEAVGEDLGVSGRTVMRWADSQGLPLGELSRDIAKTRAATEATEGYGLARRLELSNRLFSKLGEVVETSIEPSGLKDLATAFGILTDKRRLEEGQATERTESSVTDLRSRVESRLDELAQRRQQKAG